MSMKSGEGRAPADAPEEPSTVAFPIVLHAETDAINARRKRLGRPTIQTSASDAKRDEEPAVLETTGLALSGGGIRSAAFCLGALQALDATDAAQGESGDHALTALDHIDYLSTVSGGGYIGTSMVVGMTSNGGSFPFKSKLDQDEPASIQHIRDHSNYLLPHGYFDAFQSAAIYLRGLAANALLVLPILLVAVVVTIACMTVIRSDEANEASLSVPTLYLFVPAAVALALVVGLLVLWAVRRGYSKSPEVDGLWAQICVWGIVSVLGLAFLGMQPIILEYMARVGNDAERTAGFWFATVQGWISGLAAILASLAAIIGVLGGKIGDAVEASDTIPTWRAWAGGLASKAVIWIGGLAVPFLLWVAYLYLTLWGLPNRAIPVVYIIVAVVSFLLGYLLLKPNANSMHRLYRERLGKAFHFVPPSAPLSSGQVPEPRADMRIHNIDTTLAPYPLINAALNIHGSKFANRRGRDAEFFVFSPCYVGSDATAYCDAKAMANAEPELNMATAMAISGAAASSNMGSSSIRPLTPTLALLNIRLGYWMRNPQHVQGNPPRTNFYLAKEMLSWLDETSNQIYLTDGGHIENLGIYQLLKRRCALIIAIDAEADPTMSFKSFVRLQWYARIDLGVRIRLPWQSIHDTTLETGAKIARNGWAGEHRSRAGPHCAVGAIEYPGGGRGTLLYVKASLTGDENDYIVDYKRRRPVYPHENTSDQFFTEEQFEVYRALGFHAVKGFLDKKAVAGAAKGADVVLVEDVLERLGV